MIRLRQSGRNATRNFETQRIPVLMCLTGCRLGTIEEGQHAALSTFAGPVKHVG